MRYRTYQIVLAVSQLRSAELEPRGSMNIRDIGALKNTAAA
jgi:hypothetical protein